MSEKSITETSKELKPFDQTVAELFAYKTPKKYIKTRPGHDGKPVPYVPIGYVVDVLNKGFGPFWEWRITNQQVFKTQVAVTGELTIKNRDGFTLTKTGTSGVPIKISKKTGLPVNIGWDIQSASNLAMKKAASFFGVASDVYYSEMADYEAAPDVIDEDKAGDNFSYRMATNKYFAMAAERGLDGEAAKKLIKDSYGVAHMEELNITQIENGCKALEARYEIVPAGELPRKKGEIVKKEEPAIVLEAQEVFDEAVLEEDRDIEKEEVVGDIQLPSEEKP